MRLNHVKYELERWRRPLNEKNNLGPNCHGRFVTIALLVLRFTVLDFGADGGRKPHGWGFNTANGNQLLRPKKTNTADRHSPWAIDCSDRYLELSGGSNNDAATVRQRDSGSDEQAQAWYIGRIETGWM
ncbi:hypothetical protein ANO14919_029910 [Xylariales sp. No.14919]|nr:hypothetical protein ANO14919_029910 [Xylariales sp. No.14919]